MPPISLTTLRPGHPRLLLTPDSLATLRQFLLTDPQFQSIYLSVLAHADSILANPHLVQYTLKEPRKTLLEVSRDALDRISTLALIYLLNHDPKYARRALAEMTAAANFLDWHPAHFLDVGELSAALALGYDWLFDLLTPTQRTLFKSALINFAFTPAQRSYAGLESYGWWAKDRFNWNIVCNTGLTFAALALADEEPQLCQSILTSALQSSQIAFDRFPADGGWDEGPGYWAYTAIYTARFLSALQTALGSTLSLGQTPGLAHTPLFPLYFTSPTGQLFNFADTPDDLEWTSQLFYLAQHFHQPAAAFVHRRQTMASPEDLLWFTPAGTAHDLQSLPTDKLYPHTNLAFFRSSWLDPNATYLALKGGDNKANHSHLDLGSFVLETQGQRWATDFGREDYSLPGYFHDLRFTYYRLRTPSHNTLTINSQDQSPHAAAPITTFLSSPSRSHAVVDLSAAYPALTHHHRGLAMLQKSIILIQDELSSPNPVDPIWNFHTPAHIELSPSATTATLRQNNKQISLQIITPPEARFRIQSDTQPPPQNPNLGTQNLTIHLRAKVTALRLAVLISPHPQNHPPEIQPLTQWQ